ncbi:MAG: hypothetical protein AAFV01_14820 [Bacteroidota bacterium]
MPRTLQTPARASKSTPRKASAENKSPRKAMATRATPSARKPSTASPRKATADKAARPARAKSGASTGRRPSTPTRSELPGWGDLNAAPQKKGVAKNVRTTPPRKAGAVAPSRLDWLTQVPTRSFLLGIALVCALLTLWVAHVFSMEAALADITRLRAENEQLHLRSARLDGEFDARTSPAVILDRARALGLVEDATYAPTIAVTPSD